MPQHVLMCVYTNLHTCICTLTCIGTYTYSCIQPHTNNTYIRTPSKKTGSIRTFYCIPTHTWHSTGHQVKGKAKNKETRNIWRRKKKIFQLIYSFPGKLTFERANTVRFIAHQNFVINVKNWNLRHNMCPKQVSKVKMNAHRLVVALGDLFKQGRAWPRDWHPTPMFWRKTSVPGEIQWHLSLNREFFGREHV